MPLGEGSGIRRQAPPPFTDRFIAHVLSPEQIAAMYNGGSGNPNVIVSQETAAGEDWQCEVTPFSAEEMGTTQFSNTVTIVASNDADGDGIPDTEDGSGTCLSSTDDDSDDDGILDGNEDLNRNGVWDEGETDFCNADTDGDLILDGTEIGLTAPQGSDTDLGVFVADADGGTTTNPLNPDTDGDGVDDGVEDANQNGAVDPGETDPLAGPSPCEPVTVMPLGNSITDGYSVNGGYRGDLYDALVNGGYDVDFVGGETGNSAGLTDPDHEGHSGWDADEIRDNIIGWLSATPADIVLLHIGTNDMSTSQSAADVADEIGQILDNIDTYSPDVWVILARIINRDDGDHSKTTELNEAIQTLADARTDDKIIVVDMESALVYPDDLADALHPNASGYGKMADVWFTALNNFLSGYCSDGPAVVNLSLTSTSGGNLSADDLTCGYDLAGGATTAATAWYMNSSPLMNLYMPMEGGETNALMDYSGSSYNGIKGPAASWSAEEGYDGYGAFSFDESSGAWIDAGSSMPFGAYTKIAWVNANTRNCNNIISGDYSNALWLTGNRLQAGHNGGWINHVRDTEDFTLNTWTFVAVTYDPDVASGEMILYKNGVEVDRNSSVPIQSCPTCTDPNQLWVGAFSRSPDGTGPHCNWNGLIDDARVYDYALTPEQIAAMFNTGRNVIVSEETTAGEDWQCEVTPFSDAEAGATQASNTLSIVGADDTDGDGIPDNIEEDSGTCLSSTDDDSDDDGILDGNEDLNQNGVWEEDERETNFCDADTDDDGILDGTEIGLASPQGSDTDPAVFVADADPATTTDPLDDDSDDDGLLDGEEDANQNGAVDPGESDPLAEPDQPASIVNHPADQGVNEGASATFTVVAAGTEPISYQWQRLNGTWEDIDGATGSAYTISEALYPDDDGSTLRCFVSNAVDPDGVYSNLAILTVTELDYAYFEDFGDTSGADPVDWLDTGARNSLSEDDSLFKTYDVGGEIVFRTISTLKNIHSHYTGAEYDAATGLILTGRMRMGDAQSGIGVTFLSDYTNADAYYRLRRHTDTAFHLSPHGTTVEGVIDSGVLPAANRWYRYRIEVIDTGSRTDIRANVWPEGAAEPAGWQIDAWDDSADRLTSGRIGVWGNRDGSKYWDDFAVTYFDLAP